MFKYNNFFQIMTIPLFSNFIIASGFASLGSFLANMGFLFLAYEITGSPTKTTGVLIIEVLPYLLFGLLGGAIGDSTNKARLMIAMDAIRFILQGTCLLLYTFGILSYFMLLAIAFGIQVCGAFFTPASRGIIPQFVKKEKLITANSLMSIIQNLCSILGPVFATFIITYGSLEMFFLADMFTYFVSFILLLKLVPFFDNTKDNIKVSNIKSSFREFKSFLKKNKSIQFLLLTTFIVVFTQKWAWSVGLLFKQGIESTTGKQDYANLMLIFSIISVLLGTWLGSHKNLSLSFKSYSLGVLLWSLGLFIFAIAPKFYGDIIGILSIAIGFLLTSQSRVYLLQELLPADIISQGFSLAAMTLYTADFLSLILFGFLYTFFPLKYIFLGASIFLFLVFCWVLKFSITKQNTKE